MSSSDASDVVRQAKEDFDSFTELSRRLHIKFSVRLSDWNEQIETSYAEVMKHPYVKTVKKGAAYVDKALLSLEEGFRKSLTVELDPQGVEVSQRPVNQMARELFFWVHYAQLIGHRSRLTNTLSPTDQKKDRGKIAGQCHRLSIAISRQLNDHYFVRGLVEPGSLQMLERVVMDLKRAAKEFDIARPSYPFLKVSGYPAARMLIDQLAETCFRCYLNCTAQTLRSLLNVPWIKHDFINDLDDKALGDLIDISLSKKISDYQRRTGYELWDQPPPVRLLAPPESLDERPFVA